MSWSGRSTSPASLGPLVGIALSLVVLSPAQARTAEGEARVGQSQERSLAARERFEPIRLDLTLFRPLGFPEQHPLAPTEEALRLGLPSQPPGEFVLRIRLHAAFSFYVTADLDSELPRLDAVDGETYFSTGAELRLTPLLGLFVEDFQPASGVIGDEELEENPSPERSWDGHQVSIGLRVSPREDLEVRGEAIAYVLSVTDRSSGVGGMLTVSYRF
jgi:hypothetical protein